ncbi:hypothetical protein BHE74_00055103 [Ensete ventricosum]|nr:hypothetical protein GW17_00053339 [Ensete ventricosum]RWW39555.1 hypothetical protein BHE74_00055103 [Ensete ventricosum]RZS26445.1 hypothetical protein BHM03_00059791 [Ensete ventricosum]
MGIPYLVLLLIANAAAAAAANRVDETAVRSRDCYAGNTLLPMQDSCCHILRRIHCHNNGGVGKVQSAQSETEFTSTAVQSPQTGVASSAVSDPYCEHSFPSLT